MAILSPSILAADFGNLQRDVEGIGLSGGRWVHFDVMDGNFVPNISFGIPVLKAVRKITPLVLDVHLMIDRPIRYVETFRDAGADWLTVHLEADTPEKIHETLKRIGELGMKRGLSVKPGTPAEAVEPFLKECDMLLVMTVEPGFGGQKFMQDMMEKVTAIRRRLDEVNPACLVEVDGGVHLNTAPFCKAAGAEVLVSGSAYFKAADKAAFVHEIEA